MPESVVVFLQGFVMVWEAAAPKPLQNLAKNKNTFPAFAKIFQSFAKTPKRPKTFPAPKTSPGSKTFAKVFGAGKVFGLFELCAWF